MMEKKLISANDEKEFIGFVLDYVEKKSMTISNITDAVDKVILYMKKNATLEKGTAN